MSVKKKKIFAEKRENYTSPLIYSRFPCFINVAYRAWYFVAPRFVILISEESRNIAIRESTHRRDEECERSRWAITRTREKGRKDARKGARAGRRGWYQSVSNAPHESGRRPQDPWTRSLSRERIILRERCTYPYHTTCVFTDAALPSDWIKKESGIYAG